jgi:hypothetical protein
MKKGENLSDTSDEPWPISFVSTYPVAGITLYTLILVDNGLSVLV